MSYKYVLPIGTSAVVISDHAAETIKSFRQLEPQDKEAGGQLFARFNEKDTIIVEATKPKLLDRRSRSGFRPNRWLQRREIRERHKRGLHFVGDWHTHPEPVPVASAIDLSNTKDCFNRSQHELKAFVMIIAGTKDFPEGLYVALVEQNSLRPMAYEKSLQSYLVGFPKAHLQKGAIQDATMLNQE